ncbi:MAG: AmmeMemoRadiSam system protein A [Oscillospiraceae bacterium]|jgi:AmmeMemoRadiSam system protein A|nr:AmmeMemoRadiSam system protein A [Oscillospiraceae bacterium]
MSILRAYALPHPPLAVPGVGDGDKPQVSKTLAAFDEAAREIAALAPETVIFVTPHSVLYSDYFHISPGGGARGSFSRFGAREACLEAVYDTEMAEEIIRLAGQSNIRAGTRGERDAALDHGVMVPMWFINRHYQDYKTVRVSQSGFDPSEHYRLGQCVARAAERTKAVLIASGDLSHKHGGSYGYAPESEVFDGEITRIFATGDFLALFAVTESLRERAAECGYNSFMVLAGCFDRLAVAARRLSYEAPFGVGYAAASFSPGGPDEKRDFLEQYEETALAGARERQSSEDAYRALARRSLEYTVQTGKTLPLPDGLPEELMNVRAGAFVSLHKYGRLRGCVGTIAPTAGCVAAEIIQNAVSAGLHDNRFDPVTASELPHLTYKVDVLSPPETVASPAGLDVKRYGVIVSSGHRRGLLLPDLEGVDTVEEQLAIARNKGGIPDGAPVKIERFEVVRHE